MVFTEPSVTEFYTAILKVIGRKPALRRLFQVLKGDPDMELQGRRVAILAENLYEDLELWYPLYRLRRGGR